MLAGPHDDVPAWMFGCPVTQSAIRHDFPRHGKWSVAPDQDILMDVILRWSPQVERDVALRNASGRWVPNGEDPEGYVPGDVAAVRSMVGNAAVTVVAQVTEMFSNIEREVLPGAAFQAASINAIYSAVPYFMDAPIAQAIATSTPPPPEELSRLRMPHEACFVLFGDDIRIHPSVWNDPEWAASPERPAPYGLSEPIMRQVSRMGGGICGVILLAHEDGRLRDDFIFVLCGNPDPNSMFPTDKLRGVVWCWRSRAAAASIVENVAAYIAWGDWTSPQTLDLPDRQDRKAWRKAVRTSQFRKGEPRGAAAAVHVVAWKPAPVVAPTAEDSSAPGRLSPLPHHRRGHWRNIPIGPREEHRREPRWIPPVWVTPHGPVRDADHRERVWLLGDPDNQ